VYTHKLQDRPCNGICFKDAAAAGSVMQKKFRTLIYGSKERERERDQGGEGRVYERIEGMYGGEKQK